MRSCTCICVLPLIIRNPLRLAPLPANADEHQRGKELDDHFPAADRRDGALPAEGLAIERAN